MRDPRSVGLPAEPSAHAQLSRRAGDDARGRVREPLPRREAARGELHRRGRGDRHAARRAGRGGDRERRQRAARRAPARRAGAGGGAAAARPRAPRRDRPGADVDPARPRRGRELEDGRGGPRCRRRAPRRSSSRRCRACGGWPSSSARRRSTTSGSSRRCGASARRVREGGALDVQVETRLGPSASRRMSRPRSTASCRRRSRTSSSMPARTHVSIVVTRKSTSVHGDDRGRRPRLRPRRRLDGEGLGLLGMRERVELLDGTLEIDAAPGCRDDAHRRAAARLSARSGSGGRVAASAASVRPKAGANLNPCPEQADATTIRPCRSRTNDSSAVFV